MHGRAGESDPLGDLRQAEPRGLARQRLEDLGRPSNDLDSTSVARPGAGGIVVA
jgi:hypothetical protein